MSYPKLAYNQLKNSRFLSDRKSQDTGFNCTRLYYYEHRYYNPKNGPTFLSVDPLAEQFPYQSPYCYAANNPIRFIDFMGLSAGDPPSVNEGNPIMLPEATATGRKPSSFSSEGNYGSWTSSYTGNLADWNREYGSAGDDYYAAMDNWQRQMVNIENNKVKQSVNETMNNEAVTIAALTIGTPVAIIGGAELATAGLINLPQMGGEFASQLVKHDFNTQDAVMNFNVTSAIPGGNIWGKGANVAAGTIFEYSSLENGLVTHKDGFAGYSGRATAGIFIQYTGTKIGNLSGAGASNSYGNYINILTTYGQKYNHANIK